MDIFEIEVPFGIICFGVEQFEDGKVKLVVVN